MNPSPSHSLRLAFTVAACIGLGLSELPGQGLPGVRRGPVRDALNVQGVTIDSERVQRQVEVARLERIIDRFDGRVIRLERQLLAITRMPMITITEAEASLALAKAQLQESQQLHAQGQATDVRLAADRLALVRAQGQLDTAQAAHIDSLTVLEMEVLHAERQLLEKNQEKTRLERMVAKGYTTSDGLRLHLLDVSLAEKQLQLAKSRLTAQQRSAASDEPAAASE